MNPRHGYARSFTVAAALLAGVLLTGCQGGVRPGAGGVGLLPGPPPGEPRHSQYTPDRPYAQMAPGVLTRTEFQVASGTGYRVEVRDLLVGPRQHSAMISLPGAAVFEVRSGAGVLTAEGQPRELRTGSTFALSEGASFMIENRADSSLAMRVHIFMLD